MNYEQPGSSVRRAPDREGTSAEELAYRLRQQEVLADFGRIALETRDFAGLLREATRLCAEGMHTGYCKALEYLPDEDRFIVRAGVGWKPGTIRSRVGADPENPAGYAFRADEPVISSHPDPGGRFRTPQILAEHGIRRAVNVPIRTRHRRYGVLEVDSPLEGQFTEADITFMQGFANLLGVALERGSGEEALRRSEERLRGAFAISTVGVLFWGEGFRLTEANDAFLRMTGFSREEAIGKTWQELTPEEFHQASRHAVEEITARGEITPYEKQYFRKDGSRWWGRFAARRIGDEVVEFVLDVTDRREAEAGRHESEALLGAVLDALPAGVIIADANGRIVRDNAANRELWGIPPETASWADYDEWVGYRPGTGERIKADEWAMARALLHGEVVRGELVENERFGTGERRLYLNNAAPVRDDAGRIIAGVVAELDVTERLAAEKALRESEARLSQERARLAALVDNLPVGVCFLDPDGKPLLSNPAFRRFLPDEPMPSRLPDGDERWTAWDEEGQRLPRDRYPGARALRGETVPGIEFLHRPDEGRSTWVRVSGIPLFDADGGVTAALIVVVDIDAQKRAREALQSLNRNLEREVAARTAERDRVWQNSNELMGVFGPDGRRRAINPAWARVLGHDEATLPDRPMHEITHPDDRGRLEQAVQRLARGEPIDPFEGRMRHADGSYRTISWTGVPGDGVFYAIGRDVTEQRHAEEQLRQAQKMEAVGQLTGGIAHDFNNLLAGIVGSLDLMQTRVAQGRTENVERYVKAAMSSAQRAAALTHRLLAFSRRQPLDPKSVDANQLVASMEDLLRRTIGPQHSLEIVNAGGLWTTLCDPNQLESAILNLAINARDAMPDGGKLTIETANAHLDEAYAAAQRDVTPGQYVCICVTDTGTGMQPGVIARALEPFFTTKPLGQGTGLGLSMVYGFAKQSEGHLRIRSEVGHGTTIRIYLPRHRGASETEDVSGSVAGEAPRAEAGETVLVVEDEPVIHDLIVEVLQDLGYRALEASDGPAGLRILQSRRRIDLLVTDVGLPGINGRQLADQARETRPGLKVLFITGYAENATLAGGFLDPGMEMITKPFAVEALATRIRDR